MSKSVFSADLRIVGDIASNGDVDVHGSIEGTISVRDMSIAPEAVVEGTVRAVSVDIAGHVTGRLECEHVAIAATGSLDGDVSYRTLSVVPGGELNARCAPVPQDKAVIAAASDGTPASGRAGRSGRAERPSAMVRGSAGSLANVSV